jgi:hypothetical protein
MYPTSTSNHNSSPVPTPPYGQQAPYGQYAPAGYGPIGQMQYAPQPAKKSRRLPVILALVAGVLVLACAVGTVAIVAGINAVNNSPGKAAAQQYYAAIQTRDYAKAYSYLDPTMTMNVAGQDQQISQELFNQAAQAYDQSKGAVSSYALTDVSVSAATDTGNTANVTVRVTRNGAAYDVHLQLKQEGSAWKVVSFDSL